MPFNSAFPAPLPLPGKKKTFPEVRGRAIPSCIRKFIAKPTTSATCALPVKPSATEARSTSPLAVKTPPYASALLKHPEEVKLFHSRIPVRIPASTTGRPVHQGYATTKRDDGPRHPVAENVLGVSFVSRIPVRKAFGRAVPHEIQPTTESVLSEPTSQPLDDEATAPTEQPLESSTVPLPSRRQKRNAALKERRKAKKRGSTLLMNDVPSPAEIVDDIATDDHEAASHSLALVTPVYNHTSAVAKSADAESVQLNSEKSEEKAPLKRLEDGHPPFLPYVFVMDCIRPYVPAPSYEVKRQPDEEYLHVSNIPFSVPSEEVVGFFEKLAGPVRFFSMQVNENGLYSGKANVIFCHPNDSRKALLLYDGSLIGGRKLKIKLFVNGERLYPNQVTLPEPAGCFKVDWVNAAPSNMVLVPSADYMMEFISHYPTNFKCKNV